MAKEIIITKVYHELDSDKLELNFATAGGEESHSVYYINNEKVKWTDLSMDQRDTFEDMKEKRYFGRFDVIEAPASSDWDWDWE